MNKQYLRPLCGTLVAGLAAFAQCAFAGTSTWKAGSTGGWNDPGSWDGGIPDSSTTVLVPDNVDLPVTDADVSCAGAVSAITLGTGSRIIFNVTENECTMAGTITGDGTIVKYGTNIVHLTNETQHGYYAKGGGMEVYEGILECPQTFPGSYSSTTMNIGPLYVAEGATFKPYARYRTTVVSSLTGKGTVMLPVTLTGGYWPFRYDSNALCSFEGSISGQIMLQINGPIDLVSMSNSFTGSFSLYNINADVGVLKFGNGQEGNTSIGCCWFQWDSSDQNRYVNITSSGRIRYIGEGETSSRTFRFSGTSGGVSFILDAGATGGLDLTGNFIATVVGQKVVTFAGSNTTVCVHRGGTGDYGDNTLYFAKSGTGTWRFEGNTNRLSRGVVGVEQGTLQFDSLTETNVPCSFGLSTRLAKKYVATEWDESRRADYAILLGSADAEGVLEWVGTNLWGNASSTRPVAVTGQGGRIVSSVAGRRIGLRGAFAADEGGGTLTLDGNGTTNYLYNVSDGHGTMSLAKDGSGTWVLAGDQTFSGKLSVNAGEVVVSSTASRKYSWYKFTVKETVGDPVRIRELALFNSSGTRLNKNLAELGANVLPKPGQISVWANQYSSFAGSSGYSVAKMFDDSTNWKSISAVTCGGAKPSRDNPNTWVPFVMRLADSADDVYCYDFIPDQTYTHGTTAIDWTLEASADGVFWDKVHEVVGSAHECPGSTYWISDNSSFTAGAAHTSEFTFGLDNGKSLITGTPNQLSNATVTVTAGAVLRAEGDVTIHALEGGAGGIGTIDGFAFAADGTFNLAGVERLTDAVSVAVDFVNVTGAENITGWNLTVGGKHANGRVSYANGHIKVTPIGTLFTIR